MAMQERAAEALTRRFIEAVFNRGDLRALDALLASGYRQHDSARPTPLERTLPAYRAAFPDLHFTIEVFIDEGDRVAVRYAFTGTHRGELFGIAPTGRHAAAGGILIQRIDDGRIAETWAVWDRLGLLRQLEVDPAPQTAQSTGPSARKCDRRPRSEPDV